MYQQYLGLIKSNKNLLLHTVKIHQVSSVGHVLSSPLIPSGAGYDESRRVAAGVEGGLQHDYPVVSVQIVSEEALARIMMIVTVEGVVIEIVILVVSVQIACQGLWRKTTLTTKSF